MTVQELSPLLVEETRSLATPITGRSRKVIASLLGSGVVMTLSSLRKAWLVIRPTPGGSSTVTWKVNNLKPGNYELYVTYACQGAGGRYSVKVGDTRIEAESTGTGGWGAYQRKHLGTVQTPSSSLAVSIKAIQIRGPALMDIKSQAVTSKVQCQIESF